MQAILERQQRLIEDFQRQNKAITEAFEVAVKDNSRLLEMAKNYEKALKAIAEIVKDVDAHTDAVLAIWDEISILTVYGCEIGELE